MFHRENTVGLIDSGKRFARDPIKAFRAATGELIPGIRTAADQLLRPVHDVDLSAKMRGAILFGPIARPFDKGDTAQIEGLTEARNLREEDATIFRAMFGSLDNVTRVIYRPLKAERLHRMYIRTDLAPGAPQFSFGTQVGMLPIAASGTNWNHNVVHFAGRQFIDNEGQEWVFGRKGVLTSPNNPIVGISNLAGPFTSVQINLHLSDAQLDPMC